MAVHFLLKEGAMNTVNKEPRKTTAGAWVVLGIIIALALVGIVSSINSASTTQQQTVTPNQPRETTCTTYTDGNSQSLFHSSRTTCR